MAHHITIRFQQGLAEFQKIAKLLDDSSTDIRAMSVVDCELNGCMKIMVGYPVKTLAMLRENGVDASLKEVIAVRLPDKAGSLFTMLKKLADAGFKVGDAYSCTVNKGEDALVILAIDGLSRLRDKIKDIDLDILPDHEISGL